MLMSEIKPAAAEYFATRVAEAELQTYFSNAFDAWGERESRYDSANNAYKTVIDTYADALNVAYGRNLAMQADETRTGITTVTRTGTDTTAGENNETTNTGERVNTSETYPTGYTEDPDTAYISTRVTDAPAEDTTSGTNTSTVTHDTQDVTDTADVDNSVKASILDPNKAAEVHKIIRACVFAFVANTIEGVF